MVRFATRGTTMMKKRGGSARRSSGAAAAAAHAACDDKKDDVENVTCLQSHQDGENITKKEIDDTDYDGATTHVTTMTNKSDNNNNNNNSNTTTIVDVDREDENNPFSTIVDIMSIMVSDCLQEDMGLLVLGSDENNSAGHDDVRDDGDEEEDGGGLGGVGGGLGDGNGILTSLHQFWSEEMLDFGHDISDTNNTNSNGSSNRSSHIKMTSNNQYDTAASNKRHLGSSLDEPKQHQHQHKQCPQPSSLLSDEVSVGAGTFQSAGISTLGNTLNDSVMPSPHRHGEKHTSARLPNKQTSNNQRDLVPDNAADNDDECSNFLAMQMKMTRIPSNICFKSKGIKSKKKNCKVTFDEEAMKNIVSGSETKSQHRRSKSMPSSLVDFREERIMTTLEKNQRHNKTKNNKKQHNMKEKHINGSTSFKKNRRFSSPWRYGRRKSVDCTTSTNSGRNTNSPRQTQSRGRQGKQSQTIQTPIGGTVSPSSDDDPTMDLQRRIEQQLLSSSSSPSSGRPNYDDAEGREDTDDDVDAIVDDRHEKNTTVLNGAVVGDHHQKEGVVSCIEMNHDNSCNKNSDKKSPKSFRSSPLSSRWKIFRRTTTAKQ